MSRTRNANYAETCDNIERYSRSYRQALCELRIGTLPWAGWDWLHDHRPFSLLQQLKRFELQSDIGGLFPHQCEANMGDRLCEPGVTGSSWLWWEGGLQIVGGSGSLDSRWPPTPTWSPTTSSFSSCLPITPTPPPICSNLLICPLVATGKCRFAACCLFGAFLILQIWVTHSFVYLTVSHPHRALYICAS